MDSFEQILSDLIERAWDYICKIFVTVVLNAIVSFLTDVLEYFKSLNLQEGIHVPFVFGENSPIAEQFGALKHGENQNSGLYEGVYNNATDQLESLRWVEGTDLDEQTSSLIKNKDVVILK